MTMHSMFFPFGLLGIFSLLLIVAGGVLLIMWAVRALPAYPRGAVPPPGLPEAPLDILARRFASGEMTAEEYQRARDLLRGEPPPKEPKA